jgi:hypothetical protein
VQALTRRIVGSPRLVRACKLANAKSRVEGMSETHSSVGVVKGPECDMAVGSNQNGPCRSVTAPSLPLTVNIAQLGAADAMRSNSDTSSRSLVLQLDDPLLTSFSGQEKKRPRLQKSVCADPTPVAFEPGVWKAMARPRGRRV